MKNELRKIGISFFLCCMIMIARAQSQGLTVTGTVTDEQGESVIGATVKVKDEAGMGCITDLDGHYTLTVSNPKATLVFSFVGMRTEEVAIKGRKQIDVTLYEDSKVLDEVVVVGYGTVKRKDLTGSVVSVKGDELMDVPTSSVANSPLAITESPSMNIRMHSFFTFSLLNSISAFRRTKIPPPDRMLS